MIKQNDGRYHMVKSCGSRKCVLSAEQVQGVIKASCGNILLEHERRSNKIKQKNYLSVDDNIGRMVISGEVSECSSEIAVCKLSVYTAFR